jgi:hypothetical protein
MAAGGPPMKGSDQLIERELSDTPMNRMEVLISLDQVDPPQGRLRRGSRQDETQTSEEQAIPFGGWLGLMRALSELLESPR